MHIEPSKKLKIIIIFIVFTILVACSNPPETQQDTSTFSPEAGGTIAMVDSITVELIDNNYYALIGGNCPDACTRISSVEQVVVDHTISISLLTESPDDVMCAMMLTPFTVDILLTTGGLLPGEYDVLVNGDSSTTFALE